MREQQTQALNLKKEVEELKKEIKQTQAILAET